MAIVGPQGKNSTCFESGYKHYNKKYSVLRHCTKENKLNSIFTERYRKINIGTGRKL